MAVATDAMICTINFSVSFFVMVLMFNVRGGALRPQPRGLIVGYVVIIAAASAGVTTSAGITALA